MKQKINKILTNFTPQKKVLVFGAVIIDEVIKLRQLPKSGQDVPAQITQTNLGGCAYNILLALQRLNTPYICGTIIGKGELSTYIYDHLQKNKFTPIFYSDQMDCGKCLAFVEENGERSFITFGGIEEYWTLDILSAMDDISFDYLYLSGYELACNTSHIIGQKINELSDNITLIVDLGPRVLDIPTEIFKILWTKNTILIMNEQEALEFTDLDDIITAGHDIIKYTNTTCLIHAGAQGTYIFQPENKGYHHISVDAVEVVDTIGAGDSHTAGVIAGLSAGLTLHDSVLLGNIIGRYVVNQVGSDTAPTLLQLQNIYNVL